MKKLWYMVAISGYFFGINTKMNTIMVIYKNQKKLDFNKIFGYGSKNDALW